MPHTGVFVMYATGLPQSIPVIGEPPAMFWPVTNASSDPKNWVVLAGGAGSFWVALSGVSLFCPFSHFSTPRWLGPHLLGTNFLCQSCLARPPLSLYPSRSAKK